MAFEWKYLQALPKEIRERLHAEFKKDFTELNDTNFLVKRMLSDDSKTAIEHVEYEHNSGRYSELDIKQTFAMSGENSSSPRSKFIFRLGTFATVANLAYLYHKCDESKEMNKNLILESTYVRPFSLKTNSSPAHKELDEYFLQPISIGG